MLYLYHVNGMKFHELVDQITLGRTTGDITCPEDGRMSGKHAQISVEIENSQQNIYILDLGSKNFTIVNRAEITPHEMFKIKPYNLLEVGDQKFVVTESQDIKLQDLNDMIAKHLNRSIIKLNLIIQNEPVSKSSGSSETSESSESTPFERMKRKEGQILQLHKEITALELAAKSELMKLDEAKEKIVVKARAKKAELTKNMTTLQLSVDQTKAEMAKFKAEIEMKKKKIINLKDIPTDSSEELPE